MWPVSGNTSNFISMFCSHTHTHTHSYSSMPMPMLMPMALSPCFMAMHNPGVFIASQTNRKLLRTLNFDLLKPKATGEDKESKPKKQSVICTDCDGNGTVQCSQCKGSGVNSEDFFNGKFKVGDSCWLCGGRQEMLCGSCNGAGFVGGFLSGFDS